jgi:hypothetical protein
MANVLDQFLAHARQHPGVWFCRALDLARYWQTLGA